MREILFRGKLANGKWAYGNLDIGYNGVCIITPDRTLLGSYGQVDPETVGQYTGMKDKNGNPVFEGDILTIAKQMDGIGGHYFPAIKYPAVVLVKWDMCSWMWETSLPDRRYIHFPDAWCHFECEVNGNIHDNPELVKEEPK